jgi:2-hydroxy-6-oxonona-2,4-dienedioate hydrolase
MSHGRTRYFEAGSGEDLILIHGAGFLSGGHSWLSVMPALAEHFHVYAPDCLGFGPGDHLQQPYSFSYLVDHIREFQDTLGIKSSHVVGHSMGGWIGVLLAYESPHRIHRLVNVAGGGTQTRTLPSMFFRTPPGEEEIRAKLAHFLDPGAQPLGSEVVAERISASTDQAKIAAFRRFMDHLTNPETRLRYNTIRRLPHITAPMLVLWGAQDEVNALEAGRQTHALVPGSQLKVLDGVGHYVAQEAPSEFIETVLGFLTTC